MLDLCKVKVKVKAHNAYVHICFGKDWKHRHMPIDHNIAGQLHK